MDESQYLPKNGQAAIGLQVNLGRGLLIDQRRADLKKAAIYAKATVVEQRLMLLDLIQEATYVYWNWWLAYANKATYLEDLPAQATRLNYRVICGPTGSGKTRLLQALALSGAQVLDLEALASHRSS